MLPDHASLRFVIPFRRAAWRDANPDVVNCMRPGPFGNPFVPVDPRNPEHVRAAVDAFAYYLGGRIPPTPAGYCKTWKAHPTWIHSDMPELARWGEIGLHFACMLDRIDDLATRDHTRIVLGFTTRRFGCSCALDAPACHTVPIAEFYLKCRKEHEGRG